VFLERRHVLGHVSPRQQSAVHSRVKCLYAAVHHLGEAGHVADVGDLEPGLAQRTRGTARRDEIPAQADQPAGEVD
jgi:hypothetical protein